MDNIIQTPIVEEVEQSFLDYSLSVITDRAIPAVEDGCKPVVRRILWSMFEGGYKNDKAYVKCARPVGDIMGKYHPHGDSSIYGALVGISQPWNMRYPLIDFHGNNGSRDGDGPAAMRYTECRLSKIAEVTLADIKKNSVDWVPNFDETAQEPVYLPGLFPNLICNGTTGIAVAMACNFAPHNLKEVVEAIKHYLSNEKEKILDDIKAPDFPTGGTIINADEMRDIYRTGKGRVKLRGDYILEKNAIVFTSIPYKVSKETLQQDIDKLCEEGKIEGITAIRDESNSKGIRFVIELARGISGDVIARQLYKYTDLETSFSINQVGLLNKSPKLMTMFDLIEGYARHQLDVYKRSLEFDVNKLNDRIEIINGLLKAMEDIDNIIVIIKKSESAAKAKENLIAKYKFTNNQVDAILNMRLSKLAHMEKIALEDELHNKEQELEGLKFILSSEENLHNGLIEKLNKFVSVFGDARRTALTNIKETKEEKEVAEIIPEDVVVKITEEGLISRIPTKKFKPQKRGGVGYRNKGEVINNVISTNTVDILMVFTSFGKVYRLSIDDIPADKAVSLGSLVQFEMGEKYVTAASMSRDVNNQFVWFITKNGVVKRTALKEYVGAKRKTGTVAVKLREGDELIRVFISPIVDKDIMIFTHDGFAIRSAISQFSISSRTAIGIKGINLGKDDYVINAGIVQDNLNMAVFTEDGMGKKLALNEFPVQNRGGKGIKCVPNGNLADAIGLLESENLLIIGTMSNICIKQSDLDIGTRQSIGKKVIKNGKIIQVIAV